jgi:hypothetical protein
MLGNYYSGNGKKKSREALFRYARLDIGERDNFPISMLKYDVAVSRRD